ncbi:MAG: tetratricopeptide repeat protein [candidate division KSB1 bacterium]|nr:tetratricopeptide repeat protein [candidate division KSB1 bacterium]MDZ7304374.1 tetratricopeptide repeat protein [candidate division KSB1 bacterium]
MSEMLANQYFLARRFEKAQPIFEELLEKEPHNLRAKKKLIICYTQTGELERAENLFLEVLRDNPYVIIDTDPNSEDCPCAELVEHIERDLETTPPSAAFFNRIGILYLCCDLDASLNYFRRSLSFRHDQPRIREIVDILTKLQEVNV